MFRVSDVFVPTSVRRNGTCVMTELKGGKQFLLKKNTHVLAAKLGALCRINIPLSACSLQLSVLDCFPTFWAKVQAMLGRKHGILSRASSKQPKKNACAFRRTNDLFGGAKSDIYRERRTVTILNAHERIDALYRGIRNIRWAKRKVAS